MFQGVTIRAALNKHASDFHLPTVLPPEKPLDRREETARLGPLLLLFVPARPVAVPVALVLGRRRRLVDLDVNDLVTAEVTKDETPCHLGQAHELVGGPSNEQVDTVAVIHAQFGPEL